MKPSSNTPIEHGEAENYNLALTAYRLPDRRAYPKIVRAPADRFWMDIKTKGWANRCLPLRIANQAGWFILNDVEFEVTWDGSPRLEGVTFRFKDRKSQFARSMFGFGIITWTIPYVFRTEPGFNLIARGPANTFKDGTTALDGIIETDWLPYPFTMNWKITRPRRAVKFEKDEPICMILPIRRGDIECFEPEIRNLTSEPDLERSYRAWHEVRLSKVNSPQNFNASQAAPKVQGNYVRGEGVLAEKAPEHQNKLNLRDFVERETAVPYEDVSDERAASQQVERSLWSRLFRAGR